MRAIQISDHGEADRLTLVDLPDPSPGPGEVRVRTAVAGVMYNDVMLRRGAHPRLPRLPFVLGSEIAGVVDSVADDVPRTWLGRRVAAAVPLGGYADLVTAPVQALVPLADDLPFEEAVSLVINAPTAWLMVTDAVKLSNGDAVLVNAAAGAVGALSASIAGGLGARVIGAASTDKLGWMAQVTGAEPVDYTRPGWTDEVRRAAGGGVDAVLESIGGEIGGQSFAALRDGGTLVQYGLASQQPTPVPAFEVIARGLVYRGFGLPLYPPARWVAAALQSLEMHRRRPLPIAPTASFPLARAADVHRALEARSSRGKLVIDLSL